MASSDPLASLAALNDGVARLQKSARRTLPMFGLGVIATLVAAAVAVYYIITLSADLREARAALEHSETALAGARSNLAAVSEALRQAQLSARSAADRTAIATAISDVSESRESINSASRSIIVAATKLDSPEPRRRPSTSETRKMPVMVSGAGTFQVVPTGDGFLSLRSEPSILSTELDQVHEGSLLKCGEAAPNSAGNLWRPCTNARGQQGFVSNKFIQKVQ